jgi:hypothetical protein
MWRNLRPRSAVFLDVTRRILVQRCQSFGGICCLHLQGAIYVAWENEGIGVDEGRKDMEQLQGCHIHRQCNLGSVTISGPDCVTYSENWFPSIKSCHRTTRTLRCKTYRSLLQQKVDEHFLMLGSCKGLTVNAGWVDLCGRAVWGVGLRPLGCWNRGFESRWEHGCSSLVFVLCCVFSGLYGGLIARLEESYRVYVSNYVWSRNLNIEKA